MLPSTSTSPADAAFGRFEEIVAQHRLFGPGESLSESDTRAKLIDPLFKYVLGWHEAEIRRETASAKGYADYVFGSDFSYMVVEAKKVKPRFHLNAPTKARRLLLDGPHLLKNKKLTGHVEQAQSYAAEYGVPVCVLTNGFQLIVFRPFVPGRSWKQGKAIVYHDLTDITENFGEFFSLLSRDAVVSGALVEAFDHVERSTTQLFAPIDSVSDPDRDLVRNKVWQRISKTMGPLLTDTSGDPVAQLEVIRNCYVTNSLADQIDTNLDKLLRDTPQTFLIDARFVDLRSGQSGKTAFSHKLAEDVFAAKKGAYILTGGVGSGKTTFLRRFAAIVDKDFVDQYTAWIHIDFLPIGNVDLQDVDREARVYVYRRLREQLASDYKAELLATGTEVRALFDDELKEAELTRLYGLGPDSPQRVHETNAIVSQLYEDNERFAFAALRYLRRRGRRIAIVLDNTDQLGERFQETIFLLAQKLADEYQAICVVTLREEKFFAAHRRGIFDAFGDRRFHIGSPDLKVVLKKRLEYGRSKFRKLQDDDLSKEDRSRIDALLRALINSTTGQNANIVRMLASVSNGDMRYALDMFRDFLSSGNTDIDKIIEIVGRSGGYVVPFHEFAKSAILGSRKYFRSDVSHFVNVFRHSDALGASHLAACRVLSRLANAEGAASAHGEGFVEVSTLLREYRESFGLADDLVQWGGELLRRNLIEAEPPRVGDIRRADALRISAAGSYYWRYLVRAFAYLDLILVDTPTTSKELARRLAVMAEQSDMGVRFERVRAFLEFLGEQEADELREVIQRGGAFQEALIPQIRQQIEEEIKVISKKVKVRDLFERD